MAELPSNLDIIAHVFSQNEKSRKRFSEARYETYFIDKVVKAEAPPLDRLIKILPSVHAESWPIIDEYRQKLSLPPIKDLWEQATATAAAAAAAAAAEPAAAVVEPGVVIGDVRVAEAGAARPFPEPTRPRVRFAFPVFYHPGLGVAAPVIDETALTAARNEVAQRSYLRDKLRVELNYISGIVKNMCATVSALMRNSTNTELEEGNRLAIKQRLAEDRVKLAGMQTRMQYLLTRYRMHVLELEEAQLKVAKLSRGDSTNPAAAFALAVRESIAHHSLKFVFPETYSGTVDRQFLVGQLNKLQKEKQLHGRFYVESFPELDPTAKAVFGVYFSEPNLVTGIAANYPRNGNSVGVYSLRMPLDERIVERFNDVLASMAQQARDDGILNENEEAAREQKLAKQSEEMLAASTRMAEVIAALGAAREAAAKAKAEREQAMEAAKVVASAGAGAPEGDGEGEGEEPFDITEEEEEEN